MTKGSILHERYETGGAAAARRPEFAGVNTVLSNLKTALSGGTTGSTIPSTPIAHMKSWLAA
jgi:hypothetical protein